MSAEPPEPAMSSATEPDPLDGIEGTARTADGLILRTLRWRPVDPAWASLVLVHGLGEHAGRYRHVGRALAETGIDVHGYDHRGFGGSAGTRAFVERWSTFHDDLASRLESVRSADPSLPLVVYGHSMGGLIALGYVLSAPRREPQPDLLVLSSPGLDSVVPRWKFALARSLAVTVPRFRVANGFAPGALARDPRIQEEHDRDPLNQGRSSVRLAAEADREQQRLRAILDRPGRLPVPTYVFHGADDRIVPVGATECLDGRPNVVRRVYPGLRHETHNEPEGPEVLAGVISWIRSAVAALPPRPG